MTRMWVLKSSGNPHHLNPENKKMVNWVLFVNKKRDSIATISQSSDSVIKRHNLFVN